MALTAATFFATATPPATLQADTDALQAFVTRQQQRGRRVVLVTSGGTTVPLERETVRFLDNFSSGTRGAISAELFLAQGYAVIFMHRQYSLRPFERRLLGATHGSVMEVLGVQPQGEIGIKPEFARLVHDAVHGLEKAKADDALLFLKFVSVSDYLFLLRAAATVLRPLGRSALLYLAAAVSDYFLPEDKMRARWGRAQAVHKIQSSSGPLHLTFEPVPKILGLVKSEWAPDCYLVSFKLETDPALVQPKAMQSLEKYHHELVIGNVLKRRKFEVIFVHRDGRLEPITLSEAQLAAGAEIEHEFIGRLVALHAAYATATA